MTLWFATINAVSSKKADSKIHRFLRFDSISALLNKIIGLFSLFNQLKGLSAL